jgi:putative Mg2+ transporter-C (MgtC) family protein
MMQYIVAIGVIGLTEFEKASLWKLILASVCGGLIGLERELKGQPASIRTFSLVCVGAALAMVTNEYIFTSFSSSGDMARMAAQVISGIGFLGAGTMMVTSRNQVKGLTTAATLWVTAAIGIAIGAGFYFGGIIGMGAVFSSTTVFWILDQRIVKNSRFMNIYVEGMDEKFMLRLVEYFNENGIKILDLTRRKEHSWYRKDICVVIELNLGRRRDHKAILEEMRKIEDLRFVEEIN